MQYSTRIAPSPTGMFHLGTARTAYLNWLAARASGGRFILRIDDTDIIRNDPAATQVVLDSLNWLDLTPDEIYYQSDRITLYQAAADVLVQSGLATVLENGAIELTAIDLPSSFHDTLAGDIQITDDARDKMKGLILMRGNDRGFGPTYQFASIYDDYMLGVNWIIRGHDHISNTPKQIAIWNASFKGAFPYVSHVGLIFKDGKKLSKRDNAASLLWYREQGYHPEAVLSFILRMGWGPDIEDRSVKLITRERAIELFLAGGHLNRASRINYDQPRLDNIQKNYETLYKIPPDQWRHKRQKK